MLRTNLALGVTVFLCWLIFGGERALNAVANHWQVSVTMVFGSLVGGGTSEGGGAVGFAERHHRGAPRRSRFVLRQGRERRG